MSAIPYPFAELDQLSQVDVERLLRFSRRVPIGERPFEAGAALGPLVTEVASVRFIKPAELGALRCELAVRLRIADDEVLLLLDRTWAIAVARMLLTLPAEPPFARPWTWAEGSAIEFFVQRVFGVDKADVVPADDTGRILPVSRARTKFCCNAFA